MEKYIVLYGFQGLCAYASKGDILMKKGDSVINDNGSIVCCVNSIKHKTCCKLMED